MSNANNDSADKPTWTVRSSSLSSDEIFDTYKAARIRADAVFRANHAATVVVFEIVRKVVYSMDSRHANLFEPGGCFEFEDT